MAALNLILESRIGPEWNQKKTDFIFGVFFFKKKVYFLIGIYGTENFMRDIL